MNSTAVVLMIITVLTYGIVCIGKRMELMDAVTVSFAVLLAGFGMSGGILALSGGFSLNKTLAVLWLLSVGGGDLPDCGRKTKCLFKANGKYRQTLFAYTHFIMSGRSGVCGYNAFPTGR